ncbi:dihydrodipicolinate synthase family protein [Marinitenerispora sediminis]|uniref:Dihydrodipicolinate synthase family protein n=1 Tax=Marinitenerispora sediminis TaxID=1931232 RepID=A0A368SY98_9ACTN|nr:dihydrodipicolinate synthase family protein [Marinitenerispora sediminis]RCV47521.1 dihydrodipicolinate synthase family protein [Marinitenerispora sediminis]RCV47756.1 dihydrodipicolinate synthase family protein [Marinitenerispora sediminis]RCV48749.1 dihydrodipicolinate synthase family protein [Marinitenerispora sediminis]
MTAPLLLPRADGRLAPYTPRGAAVAVPPGAAPRSRTAYAAAHVVADPFADNTPGAPARIDWEETLAFRHRLWDLGLGVADAMDTAQRGMGLDWPATAELVRRSAAEAATRGAAVACGAGTDHLEPRCADLESVVKGYAEQLAVVEGAGATPVLMASRQLAALARGPEDYAAVYGRLLGEAGRPVILHWLGAAFDPALAGYWGHDDPADAVPVVAELIRAHADRVDGIKVSVLDAALEVRLRNLLPPGVRLYTGDDFNYPELIRGDADGHSDALLGVFAAIAPAAAAALHALDDGDTARYDTLLAPTVPLARHLFAAPTYYYKTGIAFLAWLNGHQRAFALVGGLQSARSLPHLAEAYRLADAAGVLTDPDLAAARMRRLLAVAGVEQ